MELKRFGRTGLQVSEVTFGCGMVGGLIINQDDETRRAAVRKATEGGINWYDTAAMYGPETSEEALGWLLPEAAETAFVSTKVSIDFRSEADILTQIEEGLRASLARLKRKSVDLFQLHNPIERSPSGRSIGVEDVLRPGGAAEGLERMRDMGLARFIGLTAMGDAAACCEAIESGRFDSAQVYYNMLNPSAGQPMPDAWTGQNFSGIIAACHDNDIAVMNIRVLAAGVLADPENVPPQFIMTKNTDAEEEQRKARAILDRLGADHGTPAQTALRFALTNPDISTVVVGLAELSHLDEVLDAVEMGPLPAEAIERLNSLYETDFRDGETD